MRDCKLWSLHCFGGWNTNAVLFNACDACEWKTVTTMEGMQEEAAEFGAFLANEGAEQCGYCSPGFIMNVLAMEDELENPTEEDMKEYLAGNLCRCSGYESQLRAVKEYLKFKMEGKA